MKRRLAIVLLAAIIAAAWTLASGNQKDSGRLPRAPLSLYSEIG
jgi:hypothetical protein